MIIKGNINIHLEKDEKPTDYIRVEGMVNVIYKEYSFTYENKPDFNHFWDYYYEASKYNFKESYLEVMNFFQDLLKGKDLRAASKKTGVPELMISNLIEFGELSDTNLKKLTIAYNLFVRVDFAPLDCKIGNFNEVKQWVQNKIRNNCDPKAAYSISARTGINYATIRGFLSGANLPLKKLSLIKDFNISL